MREYLFRGKPKDKEQFNAFSITWAEYCFNGFVYGSLVKCNNRCYIAVTAQCSNKSIINNGITTMIEVIPETVGQFTGLSDKNGKKIFEGDIVKTDKFSEPNKQYIIKYDLQFGAFIGHDRYNCYFVTFDGDSDEFEVIGNIHDNPELMKGGEEIE